MTKTPPKFLTKPVFVGTQEYISFALLATRLGKKTPTIMEAKEKGWFTTSKYRGTPCAKWPQARDEYLQAASMGRGKKAFALTAAHAGVPDLDRDTARAQLAQRQEEDPDNTPTPPIRGKPRLAETAEAAGRKVHYESELKRIEFEKRIGALVPVDMVKREWTKIATELKQSLRAMPPRLAPVLAGTEDIHEITMLLSKEIDHLLGDLDAPHDYGSEDASYGETRNQSRGTGRASVQAKRRKARR